MHLIPPMDDEPPPDFIAFVTTHATQLRAESSRLVGGSTVADEIYRTVLVDLAGHWRRLRWMRRTESYMRQRLTARTAQWRDDQVYEVEVQVLRPPEPPGPLITPAGSLALRKAPLLPGTARAALDALADAEIAWVNAYLTWQWRRLVRHAIVGTVLVGAIVQYMSWLSGGSPPT